MRIQQTLIRKGWFCYWAGLKFGSYLTCENYVSLDYYFKYVFIQALIFFQAEMQPNKVYWKDDYSKPCHSIVNSQNFVLTFCLFCMERWHEQVLEVVIMLPHNFFSIHAIRFLVMWILSPVSSLIRIGVVNAAGFINPGKGTRTRVCKAYPHISTDWAKNFL